MKTAVIGFPRIGALRELKFSSEKYFRNEITEEEMLEKLSIYGAFNLYLDFVNIFLDILQLLGDNK